MVTCDICNPPKEIKTAQGLGMHKRLVHPEAVAQAASPATDKAQAPSSTSEPTSESTSGTEGKEAEHMAKDCPDCNAKDLQLSQGAEALKAAQAAKAPDYPSLGELVKHCQGGTCKDHSAELDTLKEGIVKATLEGVSEDFVKAKVREFGFEPVNKVVVKL